MTERIEIQNQEDDELKKEHGATHDFDSFKPHVTLSYNIGDLDISTLNPSDIGDINIVSEFGEDLDLFGKD